MFDLIRSSRADCAANHKPIPPIPLANGSRYEDAFAVVEVRDGQLWHDGHPMTLEEQAYWCRRFFALQFDGFEAECPMCADQGCTFCVAMNAVPPEPEPELDLTCPCCNGAPEKCFLCYDCKGFGTSTPF